MINYISVVEIKSATLWNSLLIYIVDIPHFVVTFAIVCELDPHKHLITHDNYCTQS